MNDLSAPNSCYGPLIPCFEIYCFRRAIGHMQIESCFRSHQHNRTTYEAADSLFLLLTEKPPLVYPDSHFVPILRVCHGLGMDPRSTEQDPPRFQAVPIGR